MNRLSSFSLGVNAAIGLFVVVLFSATALWFGIAHSRPTVQAKLGEGEYVLLVASTEPQRIQGLSGVSKLDPNSGLFMDFKTDDTWGIWMKDMRIPLDIVWLDKDKKVVYIVQHAQPETPVKTIYRPLQPTRYVLELPAGSVKRSAIQTGITVKISDNK
ncbi:hypothetical protein BGO18_03990 [Candidatus Saccharibacteria bacterium 47-87]|nr:DUF192 domain-containing protein [Candidatus Saccharibacteria bacterium]OJU97294.1 MAG: hypothetical protein BGO18_03990 [Candidatus Saccharibacteria bacterium 47-87]